MEGSRCRFQVRLPLVHWTATRLKGMCMTGVLTKQAEQIGPDDVKALIAERVAESVKIEFKRGLSEKGSGGPDRWMDGGSRVGDKASNAILNEVVAFANAYGGALVLGIAEDGAKPPVAANIVPLPRCADLAERFRHKFRDSVEPQLPTLNVVPVPTDGDCGVIVFRTGQSRIGPHRVTPTRKCPVRRADRCEELTMREIQDMTINLARGTARLERQLDGRSRRFRQDFNRLEEPEDAFGFRMTAVPIGDEIRLDSVYASGNLIEEFRPPKVEVRRAENDENSQLDSLRSVYRMHFQDWRPMLRAARVEESHRSGGRVDRYAYADFHANGLLEWGFVSNRLVQTGAGFVFSPILCEPLVSMLALLLVWADRVRALAGAPGADYVVQPQFRVTAPNVRVADKDNGDEVGTIQRNDTHFPQYPLETPSEFGKALSRFECDFWNYFGADPGWRDREPLVIVDS